MQHNRFISILGRLALAAFLAAAGLAAPQHVQAADLTLQVDVAQDTNDAAYRVCSEAPEDCSLRGAISKANADLANTYTILLQPGGGYGLSIVGRGDTNNASGDLNINTGLTIDGQDAIISGLGNDRVFRVLSGNVTLKNLTIINGHAQDGSLVPALIPESGGGIYSTTSDTLTLINCKVLNNKAGAGRPGADGSPASSTSAATAGSNGGSGASGGGIYVSGAAALIIEGGIVQGNEAGLGGTGGTGGGGNAQYPAAAGGNGGSGGIGGGIYVSNATLLTMRNTSVLNNRAGSGGQGGTGSHGGDNPDGDGTAGGAGGSGGWGGSAGGLYAALVDIQQSVFIGNQAGAAGSGGPGGTGGVGGAGYGGNGGDGGAGGQLAGRGGGMEHPLSNIPDLNRITNVTFYGNQAGRGGIGGPGGEAGDGAAGPGNAGVSGTVSYDGEGGGLYNTGSQALFLNFVTVTQNTGRLGAGVQNAGSFYAKNSIFATNKNFTGGVGADITINNVATPYTSDGYNLYSTYPSNRAATDEVNSNLDELGLLALADNGGPTLTAALTTASKARDTAQCTDRDGQPVTVDQRGMPRPAGVACDKGAFEFIPRMKFLPLVMMGLID